MKRPIVHVIGAGLSGLSAAAHLAERPGWDQIRAVKEHRLCAFAPNVHSTVVRPRPRVAKSGAKVGLTFDWI